MLRVIRRSMRQWQRGHLLTIKTICYSHARRVLKSTLAGSRRGLPIRTWGKYFWMPNLVDMQAVRWWDQHQIWKWDYGWR
jgi:hypothetical protein